MTTPRIVTLTMNPALDIATSADAVRPTEKIRCGSARYDPGGGGINVARVAHVLGAAVSAVFPVGGPIGGLVAQLVKDAGVPHRHVDISDSTRESFTVHERTTNKEYRFVLPGPHLTFSDRARCLDALRQVAAGADFVVASGSLPPGVPPDLYQRVADVSRELGALNGVVSSCRAASTMSQWVRTGSGSNTPSGAARRLGPRRRGPSTLPSGVVNCARKRFTARPEKWTMGW